jgi:hypothetical protein
VGTPEPGHSAGGIPGQSTVRDYREMIERSVTQLASAPSVLERIRSEHKTDSVHSIIRDSTTRDSERLIAAAAQAANPLRSAAVLPMVPRGTAPQSIVNAGATNTTNNVVAMPAESAAPVLGSFHSGVNFVPQTGVYELERGEKVTPADQNRDGDTITIVNNWGPGTDQKTVDYAVAQMERRLARRQRGMS